ncbi:MAG: GGDEF domain-containing protein [Luminiphilus sp.]|nr:GGDEF domain-containing protein [Luminiphilus sp.]
MVCPSGLPIAILIPPERAKVNTSPLLAQLQWTSKKPIVITLLGSLAVAIGLGLGAFEQRTALLADSTQTIISTNCSLAPLLHFRNEAELKKALITTLTVKPKKIWLRAVHVDGEILTTAYLDKIDDKRRASRTTLPRTSANRSEILTAIAWPDSDADANGSYGGVLAALPLMNPQILISIPVYSSIDPLRTDITRSAYQQALTTNTEQPLTFITGYVEQSIFLEEIVTPMVPTLSFLLVMSLIAGLAVWITLHIFIRRLDSEIAQLATLVHLTDERGLPQKIEPLTQKNLNLQEITAGFNRLISDHHKLHSRSVVAKSNVDESRTQGAPAAYFDPVTNLPCRQLLLEQMTLLMNIAARERRHVGLVLIEVGNIGEILHTKGREFSDQVLREITSQILNSVRKSDIISRGYDADGEAILDADQFCVVFHGINNIHGALAAAERLLDLLRAPVNNTLRLQVVAGVAAAPLHSETPEGLLRAAKTALKTARESSAAHGVVFSEE